MRKITHWPSVLGGSLLAAASVLVVAGSTPPAGSAPVAPAALTARSAPVAPAPAVHETLIDPGSTSSYAAAINDRGDVVGTDDDGAFLYTPGGGAQRLAPPAGVDAITPVAVNDRGDILAQVYAGADQVYLRRDGRWILVGDGDAAGLNQRGQVLVQVGTAAVSFELWQDGRATAISAPGLTGVPALTGGWLNQAGQVAFSARAAGSPDPIQTWLWSNGHYLRLPALARGASAQAEGLNDRGEVVGESGDQANPTEHVAVAWIDGSVHRLATPPATSNLNDTAAAVNDRGQVVGTNDTPDTPPEQALLWPGTPAPATLLAPGYYSGARAISQAGQVLISALVATGLSGHNEALAWRAGQLADLGAGTPIGQNEAGAVIVNLDTGPSAPVQAAVFTIDWGT
jgi:uncharacterized membrane protein